MSAQLLCRLEEKGTIACVKHSTFFIGGDATTLRLLRFDFWQLRRIGAVIAALLASEF
jgi:hypothetical protein